jgi:Rad3-related DNA helicase
LTEPLPIPEAQPTNQGILQYFPLPSARKSQEAVIKEIDRVFKEGKRIVILEAPVGSGKSAIAMTHALAEGGLIEGAGGAHLLTPRKGLQAQYYEDFGKDLVLMKGRSSYPCVFDTPYKHYTPILDAVAQGRVRHPGWNEPNCAEGPCKDNLEVYKMCVDERPCPYSLAIKVAQESPVIVHNLHSFIFQTNFGDKFQQRPLLIVDEAHEIEGMVREFITKKVVVRTRLSDADIQALQGNEGKCAPVKAWVDFLLQDKFVPAISERDLALKAADPEYVSERDEYLTKVSSLEDRDYLSKGFSVEVSPTFKPGSQTPSGAVLSFIPHWVGSAVGRLLLDYGEKVLLMSGTIYNMETYCKNLGINLSDAHMIRIGSSFPKENRPIYAKPKYQVNTSHATWNENFPEVIEKIQSIMEIFKDAKGLIHAPSYSAAVQITNALNSPRVVSHEADDFQSKLESFYEDPEPKVFVSPICQQGVDFKGDRARFQIAVRVPYMGMGSKFVEDKVKSDFPWYNYQALVVFGQIIGRVNRSEDDYGATFLLDERFNKFIQRNGKALPNWVKEAIIWKN